MAAYIRNAAAVRVVVLAAAVPVVANALVSSLPSYFLSLALEATVLGPRMFAFRPFLLVLRDVAAGRR